jgi:hypothetical protein
VNITIIGMDRMPPHSEEGAGTHAVRQIQALRGG